MVYRPPLRMNDKYGEYVNELFHVTTLNRNQVLRLALFIAPHSGLFREVVEKYLKDGEVLPRPPWSLHDAPLWKERGD